MANPQNIELPIQLIVEGRDQVNFFTEFVKRLALTDIQVQNYGGGDELRHFLPALVNMAKFNSVKGVGIVRDAEISAANTLRSIQSTLGNSNLAVPQNPEVRVGKDPAVSILILPGKNRPGMLETLLCETFSGTPEESCIDSFFQCIAAASLPAIKRPDKAKAWAYLTTKPDPHHSVGVATMKGYWGDLNQPVFDNVRNFLKAL